MFQEGRPAKGMPLKPTYPEEKGKASDIVIPPGNEASVRFKKSVVKEILKSGMVVKKKK